jgi:hypothetical protein
LAISRPGRKATATRRSASRSCLSEVAPAGQPDPAGD